MNFIKRSALISIALLLVFLTVAPALAAPARAGSEVSVHINNKTGGVVEIILRGPTDANETLRKGDNVVKLKPGLYNYRYTACGHSIRGTFTVSGSGSTLLLKKCEQSLEAKVTIENLTGHTFSITLTGPKHYSLTVAPGTTKLVFLPGAYQYSTNACGAIEKGTIKFKANHTQTWSWDCD